MEEMHLLECLYKELEEQHYEYTFSTVPYQPQTHLSVIVSLRPLATPFTTVLAFGVSTT